MYSCCSSSHASWVFCGYYCFVSCRPIAISPVLLITCLRISNSTIAVLSQFCIIVCLVVCIAIRTFLPIVTIIIYLIIVLTISMISRPSMLFVILDISICIVVSIPLVSIIPVILIIIIMCCLFLFVFYFFLVSLRVIDNTTTTVATTTNRVIIICRCLCVCVVFFLLSFFFIFFFFFFSFSLFFFFFLSLLFSSVFVVILSVLSLCGFSLCSSFFFFHSFSMYSCCFNSAYCCPSYADLNALHAVRHCACPRIAFAELRTTLYICYESTIILCHFLQMWPCNLMANLTNKAWCN